MVRKPPLRRIILAEYDQYQMPEKLVDWIALIEKCKVEIPEEYWDTAELECDLSYGYYDEVDVNFVVSYARRPTEEELDKEQAELQQRRDSWMRWKNRS